MLSLPGAFRAAARRQTCSVCAVTTRFVSHNSSSIRGLTDIIRDSAEKHGALRDEVAAVDDGIIDSPLGTSI